MYDHTYASSDTSYNPGYRDNPYKHFVRKQGCIDLAPDRMKIVLKIAEAFEEPGSAPLTWDGAREYLFREEWGPDGSGNCVMRLFRDGALVTSATVPGEYAPAGHAVRIGASTRADAAAGAPLGAVFSDLKVWNLDAEGASALPVVLRPLRRLVRLPLVLPSVGADRLPIPLRAPEDRHGRRTGPGGRRRPRGRSPRGTRSPSPGPWRAAGRLDLRPRAERGGLVPVERRQGHSFRVDPAAPPVGPDRVQLVGHALADDDGPFLGLGVSYFTALWRCKHDRPRLATRTSPSSRARGSTPTACCRWSAINPSWEGREIAPVSFTSREGKRVDAWPDYWQQLRDLIDLAYDRYGMRAEITIFADAQLMPPRRRGLEHMRKLLEAVVAGREHKIVLLEVANEAWQNGFPGDQGVADLREFGRYLAERTAVLVALSAPPEASNPALSSSTPEAPPTSPPLISPATAAPPRAAGFPSATAGSRRLPGLPPVLSNEPIGPGSSVSSENDPIKLVMAAAFAWGANLPDSTSSRSGAGVRSLDRFEDMAGAGDSRHLARLLPPDLPGGPGTMVPEAAAPFTVFADTAANTYWPDRPGARSGAVRNTGKVKGKEFVTLPMGILPAGLDLGPRRAVEFNVWNPLTGTAVLSLRRNARERFHLPPEPGRPSHRGPSSTTAHRRPPRRSVPSSTRARTVRVIDTWKAGPYDPGAGEWTAAEEDCRAATCSRAGAGLPTTSTPVPARGRS